MNALSGLVLARADNYWQTLWLTLAVLGFAVPWLVFLIGLWVAKGFMSSPETSVWSRLRMWVVRAIVKPLMQHRELRYLSGPHCRWLDIRDGAWGTHHIVCGKPIVEGLNIPLMEQGFEILVPENLALRSDRQNEVMALIHILKSLRNGDPFRAADDGLATCMHHKERGPAEILAKILACDGDSQLSATKQTQDEYIRFVEQTWRTVPPLKWGRVSRQ